jgi:hypothetical protein
VAGVVTRGAGLGGLCVLVQAASISTLAQTRNGCFMTIESSRCRARPTTNAQAEGWRSALWGIARGLFGN